MRSPTTASYGCHLLHPLGHLKFRQKIVMIKRIPKLMSKNVLYLGARELRPETGRARSQLRARAGNPPNPCENLTFPKRFSNNSRTATAVEKFNMSRNLCGPTWNGVVPPGTVITAGNRVIPFGRLTFQTKPLCRGN